MEDIRYIQRFENFKKSFSLLYDEEIANEVYIKIKDEYFDLINELYVYFKDKICLD